MANINKAFVNNLTFFLIILIKCIVFTKAQQTEAVLLKSDSHYTVNKEEFKIFCYHGKEKSLLYVWRSAFIELINMPEEYTLFGASNASAVQQQHEEHKSSWWAPQMPWKKATTLSLPVFSNYCVGISVSPRDTYALHLVIRTINYWNIVKFLGGLVLFFSAPSLSRNVLFYYASGMTIGVLASVVILLFFFCRMIPKKYGLAYSLLFFGYSLVIYVIQLASEHVDHLLRHYWSHLMGYMALSALISFVVCYRLGPVTNPRTLNLLQWTIQILGLGLVFLSSEYQEFSAALVILALLTYNFPAKWTAKLRTTWRRWFPPKVKLLTEEEYVQQGAIETQKALEELRKFCQSPDCKSWKTMCRLKDPIRFAKFVEGESHLSDNEILQYDSDFVVNPSQPWTDEESSEYEDSNGYLPTPMET